MHTVDAVAAVLRARPDAVCVASLGTATSALRAASNDAPHLYLGGAMGSALAAALGLAERRPDVEVIALVGDGDLLMGAGSLWSYAGLAPANLLLVVLDNGRYAITGGQPLVRGARAAEVAEALGLPAATAATSEEAERAARTSPLPGVVVCAIADDAWPGPSPFVDPHRVRIRLQERLGPG